MTLTLKFPAAEQSPAGSSSHLPRVLAVQTRDAAGAIADPFLPPQLVRAGRSFELAAPRRGAASEQQAHVPETQLLALEASDGSTLFIRSDKLQETLLRLYPAQATPDALDLQLLRDPSATSRGLSDWVWGRVSELSLGADDLIAEANKLARKWALEWLGEKVEDAAHFGASWLGAKALMWVIESRLPQGAGLYQWRRGPLQDADRMAADDARMKAAAQAGPMLLFIHGTASSTLGSFAALQDGQLGDEWRDIETRFGDRVFGFEHRSFSQSPIDNALELARLLPHGAQLSVVTHSRGGLVGDLLCIGQLSDDLISRYRRNPRPDELEAERFAPWKRIIRERVAAEEQAKLRALRDELAAKHFRIERYLRVACPARGTTLLSDNLDVFLSGLLSVLGLISGMSSNPVYSMAKRIVLEIADKRMDARIIPGIEAMLPDAPLGALLTLTPRHTGTEMAVMAGDIEGDKLWKRIGLMFTVDLMFDQQDNDLVVDTQSMYGGLAQRRGTRHLYEQGMHVSHFNYFSNALTRRGLRDWLTAANPQALTDFLPVPTPEEPDRKTLELHRLKRSAARGGADLRPKPVVIYLPGIMGSHLEIRPPGAEAGKGDRVWFDVLDLMRGGLAKLHNAAADVAPEALFQMFYGDLAEHLEDSHIVLPFTYDWRRPLDQAADRLAQVLSGALRDHAGQPVRLLAHSMGGLVVRTMIARHPALWDAVVARPGGRLVMLGTPNNGSHLMVETLLGRSSSMRNLARIDTAHSLQQILDLVGTFTGALQLLPRPGFSDAGTTPFADYFATDVWPTLKLKNNDRWFGNQLGGLPDKPSLQTARGLWNILTDNNIPHPDKVCYVFGQADNTPCGITVEGNRLRMVGTREGDGSVSWKSGRLSNLAEDHYWYMPVGHADLTDSSEHFNAIDELLFNGHTERLERPPVSRGAAAELTLYDAGPVPYPSEAELARSLLGSRPKRPTKRHSTRSLRVAVRAMDLRFAQLPVMCGHYPRDAIAGAEWQIDAHIVGGALTQRERLGVYAGDIGSCALVLNPMSEEDRIRGSRSGALIVGLGEFGKLTATNITETVRAGVLRYLLHAQDVEKYGPENAGIGLSSVLIGYNSTANITIEDSLEAIVRGVCEANLQFGEGMKSPVHVNYLEVVELFLDNAINAAQAARDLPERMARDCERYRVRIEPAREMLSGEGARPRLSVSSHFGYWPRMLVLDDSLPDQACIANPDSSISFAKKLRYTFLTERARVESVVQQRQPGLVEKLVAAALAHTRTDSAVAADLSRTLFQLLVPQEFKAAARAAERLVLVVDGYTANLPWEMLQADGEPMILHTALIRQLATGEFRRGVHYATRNAACVIGNPSTFGFHDHFGDPAKAPARPEDNCLPDLPGAGREAALVREKLQSQGYQVEFCPPEASSLDVMNAVFRMPYRVLMIAAHGIFNSVGRDGVARSGVVLSDGAMLTAAEIGQLEAVPELVFLNCCHLAKMQATPDAAYNRLAYSLSRELIEMGVRCVVAAGWPVDDQAATTFAEHFFDALLTQGKAFGPAVHEARRETWAKHSGCNTWGAYQAYGDPAFVLSEHSAQDSAQSRPPVSPLQLIDRLSRLRSDACRADERACKVIAQQAERLLKAAPPAWRARGDVAYAHARVLAELGANHFESAAATFHAALTASDASNVPVSAIEELAQIEARYGLSTRDVTLIDRAIARLNALLSGTDAMTGIGAPNPERWALLGGVWKRRALLLASAPDASWSSDIEQALANSRGAYCKATGQPGAIDFLPYAAVNMVQLDALLQPLPPADRPATRSRSKASTTKKASARTAKPTEVIATIDTALVHAAADQALKRFAQTLDFFDATLPVDARLTLCLLDGSLVSQEQALINAYFEAIEQVPASTRSLDSVRSQMLLLARCLQLKGALDTAAVLARIAEAL